MRNPKGVLFDYGNTLLRIEKSNLRAGMEHALRFAQNPNGVSVNQVIAYQEELDKDIMQRRDASLIELSGPAFTMLVCHRFGITFSLPPEEVDVEFCKAAHWFSPEPNIFAALDAISAAGIPMGIVSNSLFTGKALEWHLAHHNLDRYFRFLMSSADYGLCKPHPAIFLAAAARLGIDPQDIWFIGDLTSTDIAGSQSAGMTSVLYNRRGLPDPQPAPDMEIRDWAELAHEIVRRRA